jgi:hypothetical protein
MRYRKITQHNTKSQGTVQVLLPIPNLQYRGMVRPCDNVHHQITPINYQVMTLHSVHASFNYDISTID